MSKTQLSPEETVSPWVFGMRHRLALALEVSGTSVQEMANELEVSTNTVGNYTSGRTTPKHATLRVWALKTGAPLEWLKTGIDPTENSPHTCDTCGGSHAAVTELERAPGHVELQARVESLRALRLQAIRGDSL